MNSIPQTKTSEIAKKQFEKAALILKPFKPLNFILSENYFQVEALSLPEFARIPSLKSVSSSSYVIGSSSASGNP
jgi:hypothetical protein